MRRGTTTISLTFEIEFADDGNEPTVTAIRSDGHLFSQGGAEAVMSAGDGKITAFIHSEAIRIQRLMYEAGPGNESLVLAQQLALRSALPEALWEQVKADAWEDAVDEGTTMYREMTRGEKMADEDYDADDGEFCGRAP